MDEPVASHLPSPLCRYSGPTVPLLPSGEPSPSALMWRTIPYNCRRGHSHIAVFQVLQAGRPIPIDPTRDQEFRETASNSPCPGAGPSGKVVPFRLRGELPSTWSDTRPPIDDVLRYCVLQSMKRCFPTFVPGTFNDEQWATWCEIALHAGEHLSAALARDIVAGRRAGSRTCEMEADRRKLERGLPARQVADFLARARLACPLLWAEASTSLSLLFIAHADS